ncbi:putative disease resistance protein [Cinnamomum micranthum f. kanehirae]|uniref:Putative disease resistance protein n=1 Tax=Cinnamomum micranthum f. kanehirae TaxID=337451 RepID=A0A443PKW2_9MAGN|nr:putative disease resistance protein [Cinnamomum micranthum f. kanehirae]
MSNSRYLLIIDDLWQKIDLENVGIPVPNRQNGSKIAITMRLVHVCHDMLADAKIRMQTLTKGEAWELFVANVGEVDWEPHIQDIAANVVEECGGMPLAITTVAKAMRDKTRKELWENTLTLLKASAAHEIGGMETEVFENCLKPSYEELKDHKVKMCFLYCSLFPKDHEISVDDLVNIWTIEGFIDHKAHNLVEASNKGHQIVDRLKDKCLLEGGTKHHNNVKMHHVIRSFAVWITSLPSREGGPKSKFLVKAGKRLNKPPLEETEDIEIISLMDSAINELPSGPNCCNLVLLFLRNNPITYVPHSFFELMPRLKILDLSATNIESLVISSSSLPRLRALILKECKTL